MWWFVSLVFILSVMVLNPAFALEPAENDGWSFVAVRPETAVGSAARPDGTLVLSGTGSAITDGKWIKRVPLDRAAHVRFTARFHATNVEMLSRNVIASVVWLDDAGKEVAQAEFAGTSGPADEQGWRRVDAVFPVPPKAKQAQMELRLRWSPDGEVEWRDAQLQPAPAPSPRTVKVATIHHRPRGLKSAQENLDQFAKFIDEAGAQKADIVCLPEACTLIGRGADYVAAAQPIPGPDTEFLGQVAARNNLYLIAGLLERDGSAAHNTAVLIGRDGKLIGKYRKICLPRGEIDGGLAPGNEYPVFDTDFGRIAMMICWDVAYPEIARELAARGAEIIFMPIWGGNETLCKARAIENQVPLVTSSYDLLSTIYDQAGEPLAQAKEMKTSCVVSANLNLGRAMNWEWTGNWRSRIWLEGPVRKDAAAAPSQATKASSD